MEYISVIVAGIAAFVFGGVWYMSMAKPWMAAAGITEEQQKNAGPKPYIIAIVAAILVAGMMRHIFAASGVDGAIEGFVSGLGLGLFISVPWLTTNYAFARRPIALTIIDGIYAVGGCAVIGLVLAIFG